MVSGQLTARQPLAVYSFMAQQGETYMIETELGTLQDSTLNLYATDGNTKIAELEAQLAAKDAAYLQLQEAYAMTKSELLNFQAAADEAPAAAPTKKKFGFGFKK